MYSARCPARGTGWMSESTTRTGVRTALATGTRCRVCSSVMPASVSWWRLPRSRGGRDLDAVQLGRVAPEHPVALLRTERASDRAGVAQLPVRVARTEHDHFFLAGEPQPLAGEVHVARAVQAALDEEHVSGQVVARHPRRPRCLFQVRTAEYVHPPDERSQQIRRAVGPQALEASRPLESALRDHVHQVVQVVQGGEAEVLLVRSRLAWQGRRQADPGSAL